MAHDLIMMEIKRTFNARKVENASDDDGREFATELQQLLGGFHRFKWK